MESTVIATAAESCPFAVTALLIDPGVTGLSRLEKMMKKCDYRVTTSVSLQDGLDKLGERSNSFNVVVCDVAATMAGLDCFGFVQYVVRELDLPVILISDVRDNATVMKGIQNGACLFLHKPIKLKEVKIMWHPVFRWQFMKGGGNVNDMVVVGGNGSGGGSEESTDPSNFSSDDSRKRKEIENGETDAPSSKKMRVVWTPELHTKFVEVVEKIGLEKAGPKKILKMMNIQYLTRENVASHLQKYRISLSRTTQQSRNNNTTAPPPPNYEDLAARSHPNYKTLTYPAVMYAPPDAAPPTAAVPTAVPAGMYGASLHRAMMQPPENHNRSLGLVARNNHDLCCYRPSMLISRPAPNLYEQGIIGPNFFQNYAAPPQPDNYHPFPATNGLCENSVSSGIENASPTTSNSVDNGLLYDQAPPSSTNTTAPPAPAPAPDFRRYMMESWGSFNQNLEYDPLDLI